MPKHSRGDDAGPIKSPGVQKAAQRDSTWTADEYRFGPFVLRTDRRELHCEGVLRPMERRCFDLLTYLLRHGGRVVSKEELLDHVWTNRFVTMSVIAQSVLKVRKALRLSGGQEGPLRTVHRVGYRIVGDVLHRRLGPAELQSASIDKTWYWAAPRLKGMPDAPHWLSPALGAFGAWALQSHGISVHAEGGKGGRTPRPPHAHCEVRPGPEGFEASVDLRTDATPPVQLRASAASPFQAVWRAAESAAWLVRLQDMLDSPTPHADGLRWERLASLAHEMPAALGAQGPALSDVWAAPFERASLEQQADLVMEAAWRADPRAAHLAGALLKAARAEGSALTQAWARLAAGMAAWHEGGGERVRDLVCKAFELLDTEAPDGHTLRAQAIGQHLLCAQEPAPPTTPPGCAAHLALRATNVPPHGARWALLAALQQRLHGAEGVDLTGAEQLDAGVQALTAKDGLQALLLNLSGLLRTEGGELDLAWQRLARAAEMAQGNAWRGIRPLCVLSLGELSARLGDRSTLDASLLALDTDPGRDGARHAAVRHWLMARRLRLDGQHKAALPLIEQAWPVLAACGLWFREDAWLMAIDTALNAGSRRSLQHWRDALGNDQRRGRARLATLTAIDASLALLQGEQARARQLMVRAWQTAPTSTAKRLLAMAAASGMQWDPPEAPELLTQAMAHAGAWLNPSSAGRRLREAVAGAASYAGRSPAASPVGAVVAEAEPDSGWLWAA